MRGTARMRRALVMGGIGIAALWAVLAGGGPTSSHPTRSKSATQEGTTLTYASPSTTVVSEPPTTTSEPPPSTTVPAQLPPTTAPQVMISASEPRSTSSFLSCVRTHESNGHYDAISPDGVYRGAYQFLRSTWDSTAAHAGRNDLIGIDPASASPTDQDALAEALYQWQGASPWNGAGC